LLAVDSKIHKGKQLKNFTACQSLCLISETVQSQMEEQKQINPFFFFNLHATKSANDIF